MKQQIERKRKKALILSILSGVIVALLFLLIKNELIVEIGNYIITFTSFTISVAALIFAAVTYYSIDTVDKISSMEGNLLENEDYSIAYHEEIERFCDIYSSEAFTERLLEMLEPRQKIKTCMEYSELLQKMIDSLIWFAYIDDSEQTRMRQNRLYQKLYDIFQMDYSDLSSKIKYLFEENLKLIQSVILYQDSNRKQMYEISSLENVRGEMLPNPISRIVYYDYLGLDYRRKAEKVLRDSNPALREKADGSWKIKPFSQEYMEQIWVNSYEGDKKHFQVLIERACECFDEASRLAGGNVLWEGYIEYNKARADIMRFLVFHGDGDDVRQELRELEKTIENVIYARHRVIYLMCSQSDPNGKAPYLDQMFQRELKTVEKLQEEFLKFKNRR